MSIKLREKKLVKGAIKFYLDIYEDGERSYEFLDIKIESNDSKSLKQEKKNIANIIRSNRELEFLAQNTNYLPKHLRNLKFNDFSNSFIENYGKKDIRMIIASIKHFKLYANNPNLKISEISPSLMSGFKDYLNDKSGLTGESPHNYFTRFKKLLKDAERRGYIRENPTKDIRFKRNNNPDELRKQVLSTEELQKLANTECGNTELKKAFLFACYTGLGYAELKKLKWSNITNNRLSTRREKNNQKVELILKEALIKNLGEPKKNTESIFNFNNENGKIISTNGINKCLKNWVGRAKIDKHITFYCARHTFATQLLQYGANLKTVADAMGHANTRNTIKYLNYIDNLKDDAINALPDLQF